MIYAKLQQKHNKANYSDDCVGLKGGSTKFKVGHTSCNLPLYIGKPKLKFGEKKMKISEPKLVSYMIDVEICLQLRAKE